MDKSYNRQSRPSGCSPHCHRLLVLLTRNAQVAIKLLRGVHTQKEFLQKAEKVIPLKQRLIIMGSINIGQRIKCESRIWNILSHQNIMPFIGLSSKIGPSLAMISPLYD